METTKIKWYNKKWIVILLCIFFFPLGLIAIWKSNVIANGWKIAYTIIIGIIVLANLGDDKETKTDTVSETETHESPQKTREERIKSQFNSWNGAHYNLEKYIKANMNDADSYEHVETRYIVQEGNILYVETKFRGNNAFGAKVIQVVKARVDFDGNILEIIE